MLYHRSIYKIDYCTHFCIIEYVGEKGENFVWNASLASDSYTMMQIRVFQLKKLLY